MVEREMTYSTDEAGGMELLLLFCLEVLAFDASIASLAQRPVQNMVMLCAIWMILNDVEVCCGERLGARFANKTVLMITARETSIR